MKRKIKYIYIDGMENSGKTSVVRQTKQKLETQCSIKENGILSCFYKEFKDLHGIKYIQEKYAELIRREIEKNHQEGVLNFFLVPENIETAEFRFGAGETPLYYEDIMNFYKGINQTSLAQGLDIKVIPFDHFDTIYDVRDKIIEIIQKDYEI